jgi:hypothetical protein
VPVRVMAEHLSAPLEKLLGVDNAEGPAARDMVDFAFTQKKRPVSSLLSKKEVSRLPLSWSCLLHLISVH